jgi:hypothetical protein
MLLEMLAMGERAFFLLMAAAQAFFAIRAVGNPQAVKEVNIRLNTIWARMPLWFYQGIGLLCAGAAICFFYLFFNPPHK